MRTTSTGVFSKRNIKIFAVGYDVIVYMESADTTGVYTYIVDALLIRVCGTREVLTATQWVTCSISNLTIIAEEDTVVSRYYDPIARKTVKHVNFSGLLLVG